ncbi:MAG: beta-ketoacyl synthase N-terminal-like domain-containing protein [Solirubrobacteraceae bacterium]
MSTADSNVAVAITGMACMFPGAPDVDAYWRNILDKVDATSDPPPESWDPEIYYDPELRDPDRTYCKRGGYLGAMAQFEPLAHGIPPVTVGGEPDQWLALEVARAALADAGATELPDEVRARTAIVLGKGTYLNGGNAIAVQRGLVVGQTIDLIRRLHPEYSEAELDRLREELQRTVPPISAETVPGLIPNIIVGRIANRLDLMGPAYTVDAACASSLIAVEHAVRALLAGDCDLALAGGSQVWMPVATMNLFCRLGALSRREQLRAFDQDADGTLLGEGIGIAVLKRLDDAIRDGDRVYAVIRGVGASSDGRGTTVMAPRVEGEELALRRAYAAAGISPLTVGLLEAHGTGTPVGDVVEVQALTRVFGERTDGLPRCALGSVKSMISHTIPAAGIAGMIKAALALHHRVLPPTLHCDQPNPKLELERTHFYLNTETRPWIHGGSEPRRAGINAFGFGGINAHAVLEEFTGDCTLAHQPPWDSELCVFEGASAQSLKEQAQELASVLDAGPGFTLTELAFTLSRQLGDESRRLAIVASSIEDLRTKLALAIERLGDPDCRRIKTAAGVYYEAEPFGPEGNVVLVFPGEGAQYPNMLSDLCLRFPEAREVFDRIDRLYADHPRGHRLSDWVFPRPAFSDGERRQTEARLMDLDIAVESVLTANAAVHAVVRRLLPRVDAMLGHSTGEHSAAMVAGALDLEHDRDLARFCHGLNASYAYAASRHEVPGAVLLAIGADASEVQEIAARAGGELYLAMDNCPHQAVLVGEEEAIARAREVATTRGLMCELLPYDRAVHTPLFAPFAEDLRAIFAELPVRAPSTRLWSCTTTAPYPDDPQEIRELLVEHWTSPVRFRETIELLHADGARFFIEAGPRGNLTAFVEDILRGRPVCAVAADVRRRRGETQLNHLAGMLSAHLLNVDTDYLFAGRESAEIDWRRPPGPPPVPPAKIALSLSWPMMRLSDEALERVRPVAAEPRVPAPTRGGDGNRNGNGATSVQFAPPVEAPAAPAPAAALAGDAVIHRHLETMERFVQTGGEIMHAYLSGAPAAVLEQRRRPLVGTLTSWEPESQLVARRTLDLDTDLYLRHHTLGRSVSAIDPDLTALALMPLAMSLEVLAEAASCLFADLVVTGLRDVRGYRWLTVGEQPHTVEVRARRLTADEGERVHVELSEPHREDTTGPVVEGAVLLGPSLAAAPAALEVPLDGGRPCRFGPGELYGEVMFHQPLWQGVEAVELVAPAGAQARLRVLPRRGLLRDTDAPDFVFDPVLLDAAGQVIGFWAADRLPQASVVFPFRLAALDLYAPAPNEGEPLECRAAIELVGEQLVRSDIDVAGADGHSRMRLRGWEDKRFEVPARFRPLTSPNAITPLSEPWPGAVAPYAGQPVACRRLEARLGADTALWKQVWARRVLGRRERERFAALRSPGERQLAWLAARTAAKEAVAELFREADGPDLLPADIEILPDEHGRPVVWAPAVNGLVAVVSLTHTGSHAAAMAALVPDTSTIGIGIDIEPLAPPPAGLVEALSEPERRMLQSLEPARFEEWLLRCWCAKEAAGKASGRGLAQGPGALAIATIDPVCDLTQVDVAGRPMVVHTRRVDSLIVATTLGEEGGNAQ